MLEVKTHWNKFLWKRKINCTSSEWRMRNWQVYLKWLWNTTLRNKAKPKILKKTKIRAGILRKMLRALSLSRSNSHKFWFKSLHLKTKSIPSVNHLSINLWLNLSLNLTNSKYSIKSPMLRNSSRNWKSFSLRQNPLNR